MPSIKPDDKHHAKLENDVRDYLNSLNYYTTEATYHSVMPPLIHKRLSRIFTLDALYIRGRADRVSIHKYKDVVFEWEAKTHTNKRYSDITIELLPLLHHINKRGLGVHCLYVCRDSRLKRDCGFWVHKLPEIREIHFVNGKLSNKTEEYIKKCTENLLPGIKIKDLPYNSGSGDPYVIIDSAVADSFPHWKKLIANATSDYN